jgi:hypothetical protein
MNDRLAAALAHRCRLERELGQGGMATVYLTAVLKHDRQFAIQVLQPELAADCRLQLPVEAAPDHEESLSIAARQATA